MTKPAMSKTAAPPMAMPAIAPVERGLCEDEVAAAVELVAAGAGVGVDGATVAVCVAV